MYIYMYMYMYIYVHTHTHTHVHTFCRPLSMASIKVYINMYVYMCTHTHTRTHICIYVYTYIICADVALTILPPSIKVYMPPALYGIHQQKKHKKSTNTIQNTKKTVKAIVFFLYLHFFLHCFFVFPSIGYMPRGPDACALWRMGARWSPDLCFYMYFYFYFYFLFFLFFFYREHDWRAGCVRTLAYGRAMVS